MKGLLFCVGSWLSVLGGFVEAAGCHKYDVFDIAQAIKSSSVATNEIKARSCMWGGAAKAESGGSTCAHNSNNFGVLQLSRQNVTLLGLTPQQYMNLPLQEQIDGWAEAGAALNNQSTGYKRIDSAVSKTVKFGHVMDGTLAACSQFGSAICNNDIAIIDSGKALPVKDSPEALPCKDRTCGGGTANQDGNGETIVSWGLTIQEKIYASQCVD